MPYKWIFFLCKSLRMNISLKIKRWPDKNKSLLLKLLNPAGDCSCGSFHPRVLLASKYNATKFLTANQCLCLCITARMPWEEIEIKRCRITVFTYYEAEPDRLGNQESMKVSRFIDRYDVSNTPWIACVVPLWMSRYWLQNSVWLWQEHQSWQLAWRGR